MCCFSVVNEFPNSVGVGRSLDGYVSGLGKH